MAPCLICGLSIRNFAASMISATPALLSAPSSVVPSVVTMSLPIWSASAGYSLARMIWLGSAGSTMSPPW